MSLKCPRCGIDVSTDAVACCNCAYPAKSFSKIHYSVLEIYAPKICGINDICSVYDLEYRKLAQCRVGEVLKFRCTEPITVILELFGCVCKPYADILPGEKYRVNLISLGRINIEKI